uniref:Uncharacterized protein n=1 Tax=Romanomermis culicivorax TaxID=13658 RepID=A0A915KZ82_ROMCU
MNNDGDSYVFTTGEEIQNPHELVESLDRAFLQQYNVSLHIISDYYEDIVEQTEYSEEIWNALRNTIENISRANLWRCLVCWRLSMTPAFEHCDLCPGGFVYERIMKDNSWYIFDGIHYRDEIFGIFIYDALNDRFQLKSSEMIKCLHCKRR